MYLLLLLVGVVLATAGVAMMRFAVPIEEFSSVALFVSGVVAIVGALVIGGLAVMARSLSRIAERLEMLPLPLPPVAAVGHADPAPPPARQPTLATAVTAARPSLLGWLGRGNSPAPAQAPRPPAAPTAEPSSEKVDLSPLARVAEPTAPPPPPAPVMRPAPKPARPQNG